MPSSQAQQIQEETSHNTASEQYPFPRIARPERAYQPFRSSSGSSTNTLPSIPARSTLSSAYHSHSSLRSNASLATLGQASLSSITAVGAYRPTNSTRSAASTRSTVTGYPPAYASQISVASTDLEFNFYNSQLGTDSGPLSEIQYPVSIYETAQVLNQGVAYDRLRNANGTYRQVCTPSTTSSYRVHRDVLRPTAWQQLFAARNRRPSVALRLGFRAADGLEVLTIRGYHHSSSRRSPPPPYFVVINAPMRVLAVGQEVYLLETFHGKWRITDVQFNHWVWCDVTFRNSNGDSLVARTHATSFGRGYPPKLWPFLKTLVQEGVDMFAQAGRLPARVYHYAKGRVRPWFGPRNRLPAAPAQRR